MKNLKVSPELLQKLKIKAAKEDITLQVLVESFLLKGLTDAKED